ncbi:hypothetical protein ACFLTL_02890 [Chloroflexota bacterium]
MVGIFRDVAGEEARGLVSVVAHLPGLMLVAEEEACPDVATSSADQPLTRA